MENGEIAERDDHRGVVGPVEALGECECLLCDGYCFAELASLIELIDLGVESVQLVTRLGASRVLPDNRHRKRKHNRQTEPEMTHHASLARVSDPAGLTRFTQCRYRSQPNCEAASWHPR